MLRGGIEPLPLDDLRVVELGQLLAGPFCGQLLGDFGADVIKVEDPGQGRPDARVGPGEALREVAVVAGRRPQQEVRHRQPPRPSAARTSCDDSSPTPTCSSRTSVPAPWSAGASPPRTLWEINPRLVVTRVTGFGQTGPYAARAGYGSIGEAMGGIRYVTGDPDRPPARAGISLGDSLAATFASLGTLVALHQRGRTGQGQVVDSAIYEAVLAMMESLVPEYQIAGYQRERTGYDAAERVAQQRLPDLRRRDGAHRGEPGHRLPPAGRA